MKRFNCTARTLDIYMCRFSHIQYSSKTEIYYNVQESDLEELKKLIHTRKRQKDAVYKGVKK